MPMIQWKSVHSWSSGRVLPVMTATVLLFVFGAARPTVGSTPRSGTSNIHVPPIQNGMALKCQITSFAMATGDPKKIETKLPAAQGSEAFTVLEGQLAMVSPAGAERLRLLNTSRTSGSMFFARLTSDGNVQLWSFHRLKDGRILFSGQISLNDTGPTMEKVEIWTEAGYCDATGGNGQPIQK